MEKKEKEQQRALAEKVAILSDSDMVEVRTVVEKVVSEGQRTIGSNQPLGGENTAPENDT